MPANQLFIYISAILYCFIVPASAQSDTTNLKHKYRKKWMSGLTDTTGSKQDYYGENIIRYEDHVYRNNIHTVQLYDSSFQLSSPIIQLGAGQHLKLSFDDLEGDLKTYNYTLIHCSQNWEPSGLSPADYIKGFDNDAISEYKYSLNTIQPYTHYNVVFPNENMVITKSGNYIIKVYEDNDPDRLVLTKRFMVYDQKVSISASVKPATTISDRNYKQEIDFTVNHTGYEIQNPYSDLKVIIMQNGRWDNAISSLKPQYIKEDILIYDYDNENVFTGGNEFRYFDTKNLRVQTERIQKTTYDSLKNHVYLIPDEKRTFKRYSTSQDINGRYLIKIQDAFNSEREADYSYVHFFLSYNDPFTDGNLYILGALSDWQFKKNFRLKYNPDRVGYEAVLYLKQGYYNYEYVFFRDGQATGDETVIEGMHFETENDYTIYVYHHAVGTNYDQLIGVKQLNSLTSGRN
ncbi:MAG: DUF5103 domain-containing protein [Bacteroidetes bacterium]|nr:DUF5103 domain-containing protein [Bacteroidota bacterium]